MESALGLGYPFLLDLVVSYHIWWVGRVIVYDGGFPIYPLSEWYDSVWWWGVPIYVYDGGVPIYLVVE